jgi:hypothetical protein
MLGNDAYHGFLKPVIKGFSSLYTDPRILKPYFKNAFGTPDAFSHYAIKGKPGDKVLDVVNMRRVTPDMQINDSRSHVNTHSRKLSRKEEGGGYKEMPLGLPLKEQNIYLLPEYNQPINPKTGEILPDMRRPNLGMDTNATEYKYTYTTDDGDIDIPSIVAGQYIGDKAWDRYNLTGERFKTMNDPGSYSKFYNQMNQLGLMQERNGGSVKKVKIKRLPRNNQ